MAHDFKKLTTNSIFPNIDNVDVYKYDNQFDYARYDYTQMELQICNVPWDMGEAHIGNRTISGIGNVVYFESKENRDEWFDAIPDNKCFRFSTKFKELHREQVIDVPIPYDVCARFNYLKVHYSLFANDDSPVMLEDDNGLRDWFWFIREVEFVAPNTTRLHLMDDAFQTWIYDVDITGMVLERGHAPMYTVSVDEYLADPLDNNEYLLTEDVNFGEISQVKHIDALALNAGTMYACIATSANPNAEWGTKANDDWRTPASESYTANGNPSFYVFAVPVAQLATLLYNITQQYPQFKQTVQGIFFASADLITLGQSFTFAGTTCYNVSSTRKTLEFMRLEKEQFGYPAKYAELAKLYTSPYAHIEITDENGNVDIVRIEDTTGTLDVSAALSIAYPFVTIDAHILGVGGDASAIITFRNVSAHTFNVSGQWYETLRTWKVPTFAIVLDAATEYDYATHFDRLQRVNDYEKAYDNASASATTARDNAYNSADTALANANASADTAKSNADASATTARDNAYNSADTARDNAYASADVNKSNADASALTAKTNADASATTAKTNVATIAAANKSNTDDSADAAATNVNTIASANKDNADASATTAKNNTATIAAANKGNANDSADTLIDNALLNTTANTATTTRSNQSASTDSTNSQNFNTAIATADNLIVSMSATSTIAANEQQGAISAGASIANGVIGAAGAAASLDPVGAVSSIASGIVGGTATIASTAVANGLTAVQATYTQAGNSSHATASNSKTALDTTNHNDTATDLTTTQNTLISGTTANSAATTKGNATRTQTAENTAAVATETTTKANATRTKNAENTAATLTQTTTKANATRTQTAENTAAAATETTTKANAIRTYDTATTNNAATQTTTKGNAARNNTADRANALRSYDTAIANATRDKSNAQADIENDILQAALHSPFVYGEFANGESSATKPIALFANIVTQSKGAISAAGDEFLRYGYTLDKFWDFDGNWNIGRYFTYWKLRDFWVSNLNVPDMYMDRLRFFLFGGVTIWRNPEDIGKRNIYENYA